MQNEAKDRNRINNHRLSTEYHLTSRFVWLQVLHDLQGDLYALHFQVQQDTDAYMNETDITALGGLAFLA